MSVFAIALSLFATGVRFAFKVSYEGQVIATVSSRKQFDNAVDIVKQKVSGEHIEGAVSTPKYFATLAMGNEILSEDVLADAIIENTDNIVYAATLYVNGSMVACVDAAQLENCVNTRLSGFDINGIECTSEFTDNVVIKKGHFLAEDVEDISVAQAAVSQLEVRTVANVVTDIATSYKTITKNTKEEFVGYRQVITSGQQGLRKLSEAVTYINGVETAREQISDIVVSEPVNEVVLVGTARTKASSSQIAIAHQSGYLFPLPNGTWKVSAYYGDGRSHKGIDLCAPKGTSIFAVAGGTVTYSGYWGGYGYCVVIDHGNGTSTKYAHASKLCVNKGDRVTAGDVIALVGSTGNSTGNHLHFEVLPGGRSVDPAPYIGLD